MGNAQTNETKPGKVGKVKVKSIMKIRGKKKQEEPIFTNIDSKETDEEIKEENKISVQESNEKFHEDETNAEKLEENETLNSLQVDQPKATDSWYSADETNEETVSKIATPSSVISSESNFMDAPQSPQDCNAMDPANFHSNGSADNFLHNLTLNSFKLNEYRIKHEEEKNKKINKLGLSKTSQISLDCDPNECFETGEVHVIRKMEYNVCDYEMTENGDVRVNKRMSETNLNVTGPPDYKRHMSVPEDALEQARCPESGILKKVTSLTLSRAELDSKISKPKFVPEKLDFQLYEKFEGHMLINWYVSELNEDHPLGNALSEQELKLLAVQFCTHLLAAGVLKQLRDKDVPVCNVFKPDCIYYWTHAEIPISVPQTPGRISMVSWPPNSPASCDIITKSFANEVALSSPPNRITDDHSSPENEISPPSTRRCEFSSSARDVEILGLEEEIRRLRQEVEKYKTLIEIQALTDNAVKDFGSPLDESKAFQPICDKINSDSKTVKEASLLSEKVFKNEKIERACQTKDESMSKIDAQCQTEIPKFTEEAEKETNASIYKDKEMMKSRLESEIVYSKYPVENAQHVSSPLTETKMPPPPPPIPVGIFYQPPPPPPPLPFTETVSPVSLSEDFCPPPPPPIPPPPVPVFGNACSPPPPPPFPVQNECPLLAPSIITAIGPPPPPPLPVPGNSNPSPPPMNGNTCPPPPPPPAAPSFTMTGLGTSTGFKCDNPRGPPPLPTPPPGGWSAQKAALRKNPLNPKSPMKPLYWTRIIAPPTIIQEGTNTALWNEIDELSTDTLDEFSELFSRQVVTRKPSTAKKVKRKEKIGAVKLLDSKRSQNVGILAQSLHIDFQEIENAIYNFDTSIVSLEALQQIYEARGTPDEMELIKNHLTTKPEVPLDKPEMFIHELSEISNFAERISCLMFMVEFEDSVNTISHTLANIKTTCEFLVSSKELKKIMAIILTLGNYMNGGNVSRGQADGFGLEILGKLKDVKSNDSKITLLHYIVRMYLKSVENPFDLNLTLPIPQPEDIRRAASVNFDDIKIDLQKLQKQLEGCENKVSRVIDNSQPENLQPFKDKMTTFLEHSKKQLIQENENLEECRCEFVHTMKFYLFQPKTGTLETYPPNSFFELWLSFCIDFKDIFKKELIRMESEKMKEIKKKESEMKSSVVKTKERQNGLKAKVKRYQEKFS